MKFTKEDIELIKKFIDIKNKGYYADGTQLTEVYNRVLEKNVNVTNCGSCLRQRVQELEDALNRFLKLSEASKQDKVDSIKEEENKAAEKAGNEDMKARMARVRAARGKNK